MGFDFPPHVIQLKVPQAYIDVFGHLNHAKYLDLFEEARWDLISSHGYGLKEIQTHRKGPVILEASIRYKKELKAFEKITIFTYAQKPTKKIGKIYQEMKNDATGEVCATIDLLYGLMDLNLRKLIQPTSEWVKGIGW